MPADINALPILVGIAVLVAGTIVFVSVVTVMARAVDRLIDVAIAVWPRSTPRQPARRRRRSFAAVPRTVLAAMLAGSLLFALAWFMYVLGRARDLA